MGWCITHLLGRGGLLPPAALEGLSSWRFSSFSSCFWGQRWGQLLAWTLCHLLTSPGLPQEQSLPC